MILAAMIAASAVPAEAADARRTMERLVAFQTVAGRSQVPAMAEFLAGELKAAGFAPEDVRLERVGDTAMLTVRLRGRAGAGHSPIVFLGHMDVVDAKPSEWKTDPWKLTEVDGKLHGRGVVDNKYGVLTILRAFVRLKREGFVPSRDLIAAFTGDEETSMATTKLLAARLRGAAFAVNSDAGGGFRPKNGAPASYYAQASEKTYVSFEVTARNKGGHSSAPRADNAIYDLADALKRIAGHRFRVRWNDVSLSGLAGSAAGMDGEAKAAALRFLASPGDPAAVAVLEKDPWVNRELRTTCVATVLRAGGEENVMPTSASATVNCRAFPGETIAEVKAALAAAVASDKIEIKTIGEPAESPSTPIPAAASRALKGVMEVRAPGAAVTPYMEAGATDGLHFRRAGIPTIGAGPLFSTDGVSYNYHAVDETLPIDQFVDGLDHFYLFIKALERPGSD
jgi:acetylornithine deacetylase/succinyl-diaminopimelate desuccinylase-like protein